jgi:preprotein translocase subunit SecD
VPGETVPGETTVPAETVPPPPQDPNDPFAQVILEDDQGGLYLLGPAFPDGVGGFLSGEVFRNDATADIVNGQWVVVVGLRSGPEGRDRWNAAAAQCYNRVETVCPSGQMAIVLDGTVISAPVVQTPVFDDEVQITGAFTESEARDLAKILEFGAVPVEFDTPTAQTVSATLGKDSLQAAIVAGVVGVLAVLAYLFLYYRLLAIVVAGGLAVFSLIMWSVVSVLSATNGLALTLAGVAGIIVSIGITVDSYIVFFERLKDELRSGRTLRNSAQRGFSGAWKTILIADSVSLIGAGILWYLTVGSVRGFAFFLGLATLCDMVVAYFYTRPSVLLLSRSRWFQGRSVLGVEAASSPLATGGDR